MCALALTGKTTVSVQLDATNAQDLSMPKDPLNLVHSRTLTSGTGADQGDLLWHDQRTLTDGATESLDLHGGTLSNAFGTLTLDKLKGLYIRNNSTTDPLKIGGAAANAVALFDSTTDILVLPAGTTGYPSRFFFEAPAAAGIDVTTNDELKFAHGGATTNSVVYDIVIWGED